MRSSRFISTMVLILIFLSSLVIGHPIVGYAIVPVWVGTASNCGLAIISCWVNAASYIGLAIFSSVHNTTLTSFRILTELCNTRIPFFLFLNFFCQVLFRTFRTSTWGTSYHDCLNYRVYWSIHVSFSHRYPSYNTNQLKMQKYLYPCNICYK